ncbi:MAG: NIPSNAP family protein [Allorhizobium sp.]
MIHEWRSYRLKPGAASAYLTLFADQGLPLVTRHLPLMGYWLGETGPLNTLYHLWSYADWAEREACRASLATEEAWVKDFIPKAFAMVEEQQNRFLKTNKSSAQFDVQLTGRRSTRDAREEGAPLFAAGCAGLVSGPPPADAVVAWEMLSGEPMPGLSLLPRSADPVPGIPLSGAGHIVLRPLGFSPL